MAWVSGVLDWLTDETGVDFYRRMTKMPPVGYYEDKTEGLKEQSYSFSNPKANVKKYHLLDAVGVRGGLWKAVMQASARVANASHSGRGGGPAHHEARLR